MNTQSCKVGADVLSSACEQDAVALMSGACCALTGAAALNVATSSSGTPRVPAVFDLDALALGPLMDLTGVQPARRSPVPAAARPAGAAVNPPPSLHEGMPGRPNHAGRARRSSR
jgi:hypothetical protein